MSKNYSKVEKLGAVIKHNKNMADCLALMISDEFLISNPELLIDDNPGLIRDILDLGSGVELSTEETETVIGLVLLGMGSFRCMHNEKEDFSNLFTAICEKCDGSEEFQRIASDTFSIVSTTFPELTDEDGGRMAIYITLSQALKNSGFAAIEADSNEEEEVPEEQVDKLGKMDLTKFIKSDEKPSSENKEETVESEVLSKDVIEFTPGHKARKVVARNKSSMKVAASKSTSATSLEEKVVPTLEVKPELTDSSNKVEATKEKSEPATEEIKPESSPVENPGIASMKKLVGDLLTNEQISAIASELMKVDMIEKLSGDQEISILNNAFEKCNIDKSVRYDCMMRLVSMFYKNQEVPVEKPVAELKPQETHEARKADLISVFSAAPAPTPVEVHYTDEQLRAREICKRISEAVCTSTIKRRVIC